jgi:hypothetical protein
MRGRYITRIAAGYGSPGVAPNTHVPKRTKERRTLTDRALRALKPAPAGERYTLYDDLVPPLAARVTDKGAISFIVYRRVAGMRRPCATSWAAIRS